jgi:hypothetical protein
MKLFVRAFLLVVLPLFLFVSIVRGSLRPLRAWLRAFRSGTFDS